MCAIFLEQSSLTRSLRVSHCTSSSINFPASFAPHFFTDSPSKHCHRPWEEHWYPGRHVDVGPALITAPTVHTPTTPEVHSFLPQLAPTWACPCYHAPRGPARTPDVGGMHTALLLFLFLITSSIKATPAMRPAPGSILQDN